MNTTTEVVLPGIVAPSGLKVQVRDLPAPSEGQVVLRMDATGVSFAEQQMRLGKYFDQPPFPFVPGYDVVGTVVAVGTGVDPALKLHRFAAVTKVGGWASHLIVEAADLVPVPDGVEPAAAETVVVNGVTAWQMLHRTAKVRTGGTIVVLGANGGVGSTLVQLARHAGIKVIGTASARHHDAVRELGATPVDYRDPHMYDRIHELAPDGVDAVFDHVGGEGLHKSWRLLRRGGALVNYGTAATKDEPGNAMLPVLNCSDACSCGTCCPMASARASTTSGPASVSVPPRSAHGFGTTSRRCSVSSAPVCSRRRSPHAFRCPKPLPRWRWPSRAPCWARS
ncbi:hypothetical protein GCM10022267_19480 [Lentzea roselyniae]|uniref:Enoyl reductase (ER) domain-containing protein n=1 Tax=Lentzea roselyniae TaxID=531940 RepID=A0ABP7AHQ4_9PSEU